MATDTVSVKDMDYLDQDPHIRGQKYVCLSFISPEDVIKNKEAYFFSKFLASFSKDLGEFFENTSAKFSENKEILDMLHLIKERYDYLFNDSSLDTEYKYFKQQNSESLEGEYYEKNNFQTSIRGLKVRGSYESIPEAKVRAEQIKKFDKNFDVYIAEVGCWCPWSPYTEEIKDQEYAETQLNTLMKKYKENQAVKDELYMQRQADLINKIKETTNAVEEQASVSIVDDIPQDAASNVMTDVDPWLQKKQQDGASSSDSS